MKRWILGLAAGVILYGNACGEAFRPNERVAFVGDSITHEGSYHTLIQAFYATRFPERNVYCFNLGVSGDVATGGAERSSPEGASIWAGDVRSVRPTAATIMLGMNDVGTGHFLDAKTKEELEAENEKRLGFYRNSYGRMLDNLETLGVDRITLIKSSPYDQTQVNPAKPALKQFGIGKNDALIALAREVIDVEAAKRGWPICDFNTPMLKINAEQQAKDPAFSICGKDRVHPQWEGHVVMAYLFLKFQELESAVAELALDVKSSGVVHAFNCTASKLKVSDKKVSFDYKADALPFPHSVYQAVTPLIPFEAEFNQENLRVRGLKKGAYDLTMDGIAVGTFTAAELDGGINLAQLGQAPQVVQANEVLRLCEERAEAANPLRGVLFGYKYLKRKGLDPDDTVACKTGAEAVIAKEKAIYQKRKLQEYVQWVDQYEEQLQKVDAMTATIYEAAQPKVRRVELALKNN
jgi:lysophospholipase L1-like esterase